MTKLEVKEDTFYLLNVAKEKGTERTLYNEMDSSADEVKKYIQEGNSPEDIELVEVNVEEDQFKIKTIPWSNLAARMVGEE